MGRPTHTDELSPTPASMSLTLVAALAVRARAMIWSFLALASVILASRSFIDSYRELPGQRGRRRALRCEQSGQAFRPGAGRALT